MESEISNATAQISIKDQEFRIAAFKFQESESLLKLELHKTLKLNSEMEKTISMSASNQNVLLDRIHSLKSELDASKVSIQNFTDTINQLERENQELISIKKEQESLINSLTESFVSDTQDIQEIQKIIQGNNYMILYLERKNYDLRKRILKSCQSLKKTVRISDPQTLYEKSLVSKATLLLNSSST